MFSLREIIAGNRAGKPRGTYAVCSAHPWVIDVAIRYALETNSLLHIESTASQVNQFGGYSGSNPQQFASRIRNAGLDAGLVPDQILLGGDHIGPYPWRHETSAQAMAKAAQLARDCVHAGYSKIHLDASMACAGDAKPALDEGLIAERAATLCQAAEDAFAELPAESSAPLYVVGTEVPTPGGESAHENSLKITTPEDIHKTLQAFRAAFMARGLSSAWERVIGLVVQPGVDFDDHTVNDYDSVKARHLSSALPSDKLAFEAHSTDYQLPEALAQMVRDHFAILKVGPWLTFAFREAIFALASIERKLLGNRKSVQLSQVPEELERAMLREPSQWKCYYRGDDASLMVSRAYSYSDRCRYYWHGPAVQAEIRLLIGNLSESKISPGLLSQFMPGEYEAVRAGQIQCHPEALIRSHIRNVLIPYAAACGVVPAAA